MSARRTQAVHRPSSASLPEGARELFFLALEMEDAAREALLVEAELEDPQAGAEARSLVESWLAAPDFLDRAPLFAAEDTTVEAATDTPGCSSLDLQRLLRSWDRYRLEERLGCGATSLVYRAVERKTGRVVAIKFLVHLDDRRIARFQRESEALARVSHPAVLELFDSGSVEGVPYLVTRLVSGPGLLAAQATTKEKVEIVRQVALGLETAHRQRLVHRDIKPSNILLERREGAWRPYLADFGIARDPDHRRLTATGVLVGTPAYLAPERLAPNPPPADARGDIYALGVTFYELLTGRRPYESPWTLEMLLKIREGKIVGPRSVRPELPEDLETVLLRCLATDPSQRYPSARALAEDLERFLRAEPLAPAPKGSEKSGIAPPRRRFPFAPGLALAAIVVLAGLYVQRPVDLSIPRLGQMIGLPSSRAGPAAELHQVGLTHLRSLDFARAKVFFESALAAGPEHPSLRADLSRAWSGLGFEAEAREEAHSALELSRELPHEEQLHLEARFHHASGDWPRAEEIYSILYRQAPMNLELGLELAAIRIGASRHAEALEVLDELHALPRPKSDDPRIDLAEARAAGAMADYDRAEAAIDRAATAATARNAPLAVARARLQAARLYHDRHAPERALTSAEQARKAFVQAGDSAGVADSLLVTSQMMNRIGRHGDARRSGREAAAFYREIGHSVGRARALNQVAVAVHLLERDPEASQRAFEEVLAIYRRVADRQGIATTLNNLGLILALRDRRQEAANLYREAIELQRAIGDHEGLGRTLTNLSLVLQDLRATPEALAALEESLAVRREIGVPRGIALTQLNLGHLHRVRGDLEVAEAHYRDCLRLAREIAWAPGRARALHGLGWVAYLRNDLERARDLYREALLRHSESDAPSSPDLTHITLAKTWLELGQPARAVEALPETPQGRSAAWAHTVLARARAERGELEAARHHLAEARALRERDEGFSDLSVHIELVRAELRIEPESRREHHFEILRESLEQARQGGLDTIECQARLALAMAATQPGAPLSEESRKQLRRVAEIAETRGLELHLRRAREALGS